MDTREFVLSHLPPAPARVLEAGAGRGELALALVEAGYDVEAVDPAAPAGGPFRRIKLEEVEEGSVFDAVVMAFMLHHVTDLDLALDKVAEVLRPDGVVVVDEFAHDLFDDPTADWFHGAQRALGAAHGIDAPPTLEGVKQQWEDEHVGLHGFGAMKDALDARFREQSFSREPYLYRFLDGAVAAESLERSLIDAGGIAALGFRYVGRRG